MSAFVAISDQPLHDLKHGLDLSVVMLHQPNLIPGLIAPLALCFHELIEFFLNKSFFVFQTLFKILRTFLVPEQ